LTDWGGKSFTLERAEEMGLKISVALWSLLDILRRDFLGSEFRDCAPLRWP
jgi:hypothetical protein